MQKHVTLVGVLHVVYHGLSLLIGLAIFAVLSSVGFLLGDPEAARILLVVGTVVAVFLIVLSVPGIIGGICLLRRHSWARILVLIVSFFDLLDIPLGTALGAYSIWALMNDETIRLFESTAGAGTAARS